MEVGFDNLATADLIVDTVYKGGTKGNTGDDVLHVLFPRCGNLGGFRKVKRQDDSGKLAYVVLTTSMCELEWPDYLDSETGIFRYYGDNRQPGRMITDTKPGGNKLLEEVFDALNGYGDLEDIPPFFIFKKAGTGRDVQFLGLAAPGNPNISPDKDLVAFWRTMDDKRFQNYEAYFTILDTGSEPIDRVWLEKLIYNHNESIEYAPDVWQRFVEHGRPGIKALKAPKVKKIPTKFEQLQSDVEGNKCLSIIREHYKDNPYGFEVCATDIIGKLDSNFIEFSLTRPWRDGGRDALGYYQISPGGTVNDALKVDCALEAKCYSEDNSVGVKQMSRLISRIRYRQFGILITTSYVHKQAYEEVVEDGHPILIITATDIAAILRKNGITSSNINKWLSSLDENDERFA